MKDWKGFLFRSLLVLLGQWLLWQWRAPIGCPSFGEYYANQCSKSAVIPGTLYIIASGGVVLLGDMMVRRIIKSRKGRGEDSARS